jgi:VIT1/CCC1 family predicted Fe2+/Mn2+ transporter
MDRGLDETLALEVARQLSAVDILAAHARDELGITKAMSARPIQAALASAATFAVGAALPLVVAAIVPEGAIIPLVAAASLVCLAALGALAAGAGGAGKVRGAVRVTFWSLIALAATALVGRLFGTSV